MSIIKNIKFNLRVLLESSLPSLFTPKEFKRIDAICLSSKNLIADFPDPELIVINKLLPKGAVVLDVGSNMGIYLHYFKKYGNNYIIYGFEPNPKLFKRLKKIISGIKLFNIALSDKIAVLTFKIPFIKGVEFSSRGTLNTNSV